MCKKKDITETDRSRSTVTVGGFYSNVFNEDEVKTPFSNSY